ncbi:Hypothetical predicted protein [Pelobates cultripes]|uniref:Uncharacterized protein n=1 Tax=Pelobates cultripes TaxID=61616 RepID=A0AAD1RSV4_PELCU|nr:Hypothetical predicted protein [Pelobates cultripes]
MGGGRKTKSGTAVAPIFRTRPDKEQPHAEDQQAPDSESEDSTRSHKAESSPLTKQDLRTLLHDMKSLVAAELTKHLAPIKEGLADLTRRTHEVEDRLEEGAAVADSCCPGADMAPDNPIASEGYPRLGRNRYFAHRVPRLSPQHAPSTNPLRLRSCKSNTTPTM